MREKGNIIKEAKKRGRPTKMTPDAQKYVLEKIVIGWSLVKILRSDDALPSYTQLMEFISKNKDFADQYAQAKEAQADFLAEQIIDIADDGAQDTIIDEKGNARCDNEWVQRSKLRVEARKWAACHLKPKKYSDRIQATLAGSETNPIQIVIAKEFANL